MGDRFGVYTEAELQGLSAEEREQLQQQILQQLQNSPEIRTRINEMPELLTRDRKIRDLLRRDVPVRR